MNFILWISGKLKVAGKSRANLTGVVIAVAGVALALIIMECTLAVVLGFKNQITNRIMGFDGQISVLPAYDNQSDTSATYLSLDNSIKDIVAETIPTAKMNLKLRQPGILKTENDFAGIYFVGYDEKYPYEFERGMIEEGELPDFYNESQANSIAISKDVASDLGLKVGDKVTACFFANNAIKSRRFEIAALYKTGFYDYDKTVAFASLPTLQKVAGIDSISGNQLAIYINDKDLIESEAEALQMSLINAYQTDRIEDLYPVDNVKHTGAIFFNWLQLLDTNVVVIFILMACVAGFTLVSSMFILILDRIPAIGLLRALGASKRQIRLIVISLAMKVVGLGLIIGNVLGIGVLLIQSTYKFAKLNPEMYYLPYVPVEINWSWMIALNIAVACAAWLILVLPSRVASSVSPASTMRFE